jgi:hypothetical protein
MSTLKATPGPWRYRPDEYDDWGIVKGSDNFVICQARVRASEEELSTHRKNGTDPFAANAHLIAAAPTLYQALSAFVESCGVIDEPDGILLNAIEALARARGEG